MLLGVFYKGKLKERGACGLGQRVACHKVVDIEEEEWSVYLGIDSENGTEIKWPES